MMRSFLISIALFTLASCNNGRGPEFGEGPMFPVQEEFSEWVTADLVDARSDKEPVFADPIVSFQLQPGDQSSFLQTGERFRLGWPYLIGFDIRAVGNPPEVPIKVSRFLRLGTTEAEIAAIELDADRGVTFRGQTCIPANALSEWNRVELRVKLSDRDRGYLEVFCNRKPLAGIARTRTTLTPPCRASEGCEDVVARPVAFTWQIGPMASSPLESSLHIDMKRLHRRELIYVPNRIK